ncbi:MAG: hypothetical protein M5U07_14485 [Xanthobacteraceae bacterium]|nr:hypothetical protein [Xanthobacteraceae bacterium]
MSLGDAARKKPQPCVREHAVALARLDRADEQRIAAGRQSVGQRSAPLHRGREVRAERDDAALPDRNAEPAARRDRILLDDAGVEHHEVRDRKRGLVVVAEQARIVLLVVVREQHRNEVVAEQRQAEPMPRLQGRDRADIGVGPRCAGADQDVVGREGDGRSGQLLAAQDIAPAAVGIEQVAAVFVGEQHLLQAFGDAAGRIRAGAQALALQREQGAPPELQHPLGGWPQRRRNAIRASLAGGGAGRAPGLHRDRAGDQGRNVARDRLPVGVGERVEEHEDRVFEVVARKARELPLRTDDADRRSGPACQRRKVEEEARGHGSGAGLRRADFAADALVCQTAVLVKKRLSISRA